MTPQIIWIVLSIAGLMLESYQHGKEKKGTHNVFVHLIALIIMTMLYYWGGFFNPLFNQQ